MCCDRRGQFVDALVGIGLADVALAGKELVESDGCVGRHDVPLSFEVTPTAGAKEARPAAATERGRHSFLGEPWPKGRGEPKSVIDGKRRRLKCRSPPSRGVTPKRPEPTKRIGEQWPMGDAMRRIGPVISACFAEIRLAFAENRR